MPPVIAPGIVHVAAIWEQEDQLVENTFHYRVGGTIDIAKLTAMAQSYATWANAHTSLFNTATQLQKVYCLDLSSVTSKSLEFNVSPVITGTGSGAALPNHVTFALKRQTGLRGRNNRGRIYLIGINQAWLNTGSQEIISTVATSAITAYNALMAAQLADNGATEVILHRKPGTGTDVVGYTYSDLFVDSQRRRLPGHNRHR